jgi:XTP/dITP diphosphohydrolase
MSKHELIVATNNQGKLREFALMLKPLGYTLKSLADYPELPKVVEDGSSFSENAILKADAISRALELPVIADDSGLVVDALNGAPGIYTARYAGEPRSDERNIDKLLTELDGVPAGKRCARFAAALAFAVPGETTLVAEGFCGGEIAYERSGTGGFGYDPIFYLPERGLTMAELTAEEKNLISNRAQALKKMVDIITNR